MDGSLLEFNKYILPEWAFSWHDVEVCIFHPESVDIDEFKNLIENLGSQYYPAIEYLLIEASTNIRVHIEKFAQMWLCLEIQLDTTKIHSKLYNYIIANNLIDYSKLNLPSNYVNKIKLEKSDELTSAIIHDDVEKIVELSIKPGFGKIDDVPLIDFAAACASLNVFQFLNLSGQKITENTLKGAIIGGSPELVELCVSKGLKLDESQMKRAAYYHHDDVIDWMIKQYNLQLRDCVVHEPSLVYIAYKLKNKLGTRDEFINRAWKLFDLGCQEVLRLIVYYDKSFDLNQKIEIFEKSINKGYSGLAIDLIDKLEKHDFSEAFNAAALKGNLEVIEKLKPKIVQINRFDSKGRNPLLNACISGNIDVFDFLVENNSDIFLTDKENKSALCYAAENGNLEILKRLTELDVNKSDFSGRTPLMYASMKGHLECVVYLVQNGSLVNAISDEKKSAVCYAIEANSSEIFYFLAKNCRADLDILIHSHYLITSIKNKNIDIAMYLINIGVDVNTPDKDGNYPLLQSIETGNNELFRTLFEVVDDVTVNDNNQNNALHLAAMFNNMEVVEILFGEEDFPKNEKNKKGKTALHIAIENGNTDIAVYLINNNVEFDLPDKEGFTPLMCAVKASNELVIMHLMSKGARLNAVSRTCDTVFTLTHDPHIIQILNGDWMTLCLLL